MSVSQHDFATTTFFMEYSGRVHHARTKKEPNISKFRVRTMIYFPFFLALRAGAFGLGGGLCSLSRFLNCYLEQLPLAMKDMAKGTGNNSGVFILL